MSANKSSTHAVPTGIVVHQKSRVMEISFDNGESYRLPFEYLRVYSPSAEVRGHGPGQEVLQTGKRDVGIDAVEPVGNYAIQPRFDDGHDTGIYAWEYLLRLGRDHELLWKQYVDQIDAAGASRDPVGGGAPSSQDGSIASRSVSRPRS
ncbi:MAG: DUF971 domain-containing protein [Burkholderiaceae bacterium]|nr:DUF971 domain-containing protein [Burkholderiaceae bacterium]